VGDRVRHAQFGPGRITEGLPRAGDVILTVGFDTGRPRRLLASLAELERT
jgi:hypothetical protein